MVTYIVKLQIVLGDDSYIYNSGRMIDVYQSGNDPRYYKFDRLYCDERVPFMGYNYTFGK